MALISFTNYTPMRIPTSNLPRGAIWLNNVNETAGTAFLFCSFKQDTFINKRTEVFHFIVEQQGRSLF